MTDARRDTVMLEFGNIIGRHADWLTADDFLEAAQQAAAGYFDYRSLTVDQVVALMERFDAEDSAKQAEG
ncbi:MAG: hypothetical protein K0U79_15155 [Gammaproteobacteria bacterium]|nr:hypothetical protein [Gammaproteobacteria bacterium]